MQAQFRQQFTNKKNKIRMLKEICDYSKNKIEISALSSNSYYSTENILPDKVGAIAATSLPASRKVTKCQIGDVLISNIRPYFKKIFYCQSDCGCSADVLCFSPKNLEFSPYLYNVLYEDTFFDFMMAGAKGTRMPRGDKQQIMHYPIYIPKEEEIKNSNKFSIPCLKYIEKNRHENLYLSSLRDVLLPKLISGELDVSEMNI